MLLLAGFPVGEGFSHRDQIVVGPLVERTRSWLAVRRLDTFELCLAIWIQRNAGCSLLIASFSRFGVGFGRMASGPPGCRLLPIY